MGSADGSLPHACTLLASVPLQVWPGHISDQYAETRQRTAAAAAAAASNGSDSGSAPAAGQQQEESLGASQLAGLEPPTPSLRAQLDRQAEERLLARFPAFFAAYGYA